MAHSKIGASGMYRWSRCPGSVRLCEGIENVESEYAAEGTRAHELAAEFLATAVLGRSVFFKRDETVDAVKVYVDTVMGDFEPGDVLLVEQQFDLSKLHPGLFGTADCVLYSPSLQLLRVYDYKHGAGIPVDVVGEDGKPNVQLMYYALGALLANPTFRVKEVEIVIVQPRCFHSDGPVRRHRVDTLDLIEFAADLVEAAQRTERRDAPLVSGAWCRFCPAAANCPELHRNAVAVAKREFGPALSYDPNQLADTLEKLPAMESFIKAVREFAYREAEQGRVPPGWKLVEKRATRKWRDESDAAEFLLLHGYEEAEIFESKIKSPAQMEKIDPKRMRSFVTEHTIKESSGHSLVHESDKRPAVSTIENAKELFKTFQIEGDQ